jgi:flagellar biosynthesis protein FlhG
MTMVIDQATQLRSLMREQRKGASSDEREVPAATAPQRASVIAITSGKGGVGKTNIAVNLAITLSSAGKNVVLLDADLGLANADVICNIDLPANLSHVIARRKDLDEVIVQAPGGFSLIGGASGLARMADLTDADRQRIVNALAGLEQRADVILIDTGAGISPNVLAFTRAADHVLVVTTPEPTAITDAYAVIKVITRDNADRRISLLVNQTRNANEARVVHERIAKVARQFLTVSVFDAGHIPSDEQVSVAVRKRMPFVLAAPRSPASLAMATLATRLEQGVAQSKYEGGFFTRMSRWFRR